jgi:hypothetical protein
MHRSPLFLPNITSPSRIPIVIHNDRPFSTSSSFWMERWNCMLRSPCCFTTTSDRDSDDLEEEGSKDMPGNDNQKVLLYAVYGFNDLAEIRERGFVEEQAMLEGKRNADGTPLPGTVDSDTMPSFSFAVEANVYSLDDIYDKAKDQFGTSQNLQYYHIEDDAWYNLRNHEDLDTFQTYCFAWVFRPITADHPLPKVVPIRIPQYFQEPDETEEGDVSNTPNVHNLEGMIEYLLFQLMKTEWQLVNVVEHEVTSKTTWRLRRALMPEERTLAEEDGALDASAAAAEGKAAALEKMEHVAASSSVDSAPTSEGNPAGATPEGTNEEDLVPAAAAPSTGAPHEEEGFVYLDTRDWVLQQAASNVKLRSLLVYYPHALEHITECLHYSFLWDNFPRLKDGTPHPEGVSAIEDELPPSVERVVPPSANSISSSKESPDSESTSSTTA